jgi:hypothetical protein
VRYLPGANTKPVRMISTAETRLYVSTRYNPIIYGDHSDGQNDTIVTYKRNMVLPMIAEQHEPAGLASQAANPVRARAKFLGPTSQCVPQACQYAAVVSRRQIMCWATQPSHVLKTGRHLGRDPSKRPSLGDPHDANHRLVCLPAQALHARNMGILRNTLVPYNQIWVTNYVTNEFQITMYRSEPSTHVNDNLFVCSVTHTHPLPSVCVDGFGPQSESTHPGERNSL